MVKTEKRWNDVLQRNGDEGERLVLWGKIRAVFSFTVVNFSCEPCENDVVFKFSSKCKYLQCLVVYGLESSRPPACKSVAH